jgi:integrase
MAGRSSGGQLGENPFKGVEAPRKENPRDRVLSDAELGAVWRAAEALPAFRRGSFRMLVLTAQRRGEVAGMRWKELSADLQSWTIPRERAKNSRARQCMSTLPADMSPVTEPMPRFDPAAVTGHRGVPVDPGPAQEWISPLL